MLYTYTQLKDLDTKKVAIQRYLHKYVHQLRDFKRLKLHEKEFIFSFMRSIIRVDEYDEKEALAEKPFDLYKIEQAYEFVFYKLVLDYYDNLYFLSPVKGPYGLLSREEIQKDKVFFEMYFPIWEHMLFSNKGNYIPHLLKEYRLKIKTLEIGRKKGAFGYHHYLAKEKELKLTCYHIYYRTRYFFEEYGKPFYKIEINDKLFMVDIYSYVHVLSRHYMPTSNSFDIEVSFNDELPFIDIYQLPRSIESLLKEYSSYRHIAKSDEYLIIRFDKNYYIFWFKFGFLDFIKDECFHFRTFYNIKGKRDFDKLRGLREKKINNELFFYI